MHVYIVNDIPGSVFIPPIPDKLFSKPFVSRINAVLMS